MQTPYKDALEAIPARIRGIGPLHGFAAGFSPKGSAIRLRYDFMLIHSLAPKSVRAGLVSPS
jgi:hypothetical protein